MKKIEKNALSSPRLSAVGPIVPILPALFVPGPRILRADRKALNVSFIFFNPGFPDFLKQKSFTFYMIHMTHMTLQSLHAPRRWQRIREAEAACVLCPRGCNQM